MNQNCGDELTLIVPKITRIAFHAITPQPVVKTSRLATAFTEYTGIVGVKPNGVFFTRNFSIDCISFIHHSTTGIARPIRNGADILYGRRDRKVWSADLTLCSMGSTVSQAEVYKNVLLFDILCGY